MIKYFFQYVFVTVPIIDNKANSVHEELAKHLMSILRPNQTDFLVTGKFMKYSWFFFEILIKSMAQYLLNTERIKVFALTYF